jgi:hypothetical protein
MGVETKGSKDIFENKLNQIILIFFQCFLCAPLLLIL